MKKIKAIVVIALAIASLYSCGVYEENENTATPADTVTDTLVTIKVPEFVTTAQVSDNSNASDSQSSKKELVSQKKSYDSTYYISSALCGVYHGCTPLGTEDKLDPLIDENIKNTVADWIRSASDDMEGYVETSASCINGYLFMDILSMDDLWNITDVESAAFDLYSNTKLELEDIFYDVSEYRAHCNSIIEQYAKRGEMGDRYGGRKSLVSKESFTGLDDSFSCITPLGIYIYPNNPFFEHGIKDDIYFISDEFFYNNSIIFSKARDMKGIFTDDTKIYENKIYENKDEFKYVYSGKTGNFDISQIIASCDKWSNEKIQKVNSLASVVMEDETIKSDLYKRCGKPADGPAMYDDQSGLFVGYDIEITGDTDANAAVVSITSVLTKNDGGCDRKLVYYFDADTLEPISNSDAITRFLGSNWTENCKCSYKDKDISFDELMDGIKNMVPSGFYSYNNNTDNKTYKTLHFDTVEGDLDDSLNYGGKYSVENR